jgi:hypothetical protein
MHTNLQREIRGGLTRVEAAVDSLQEVLGSDPAAPSPVVPKRRSSGRNKGQSKKAKKSGGPSEAIRNPLLDEDLAINDERLEVESHAEDEGEV